MTRNPDQNLPLVRAQARIDFGICGHGRTGLRRLVQVRRPKAVPPHILVDGGRQAGGVQELAHALGEGRVAGRAVLDAVRVPRETCGVETGTHRGMITNALAESDRVLSIVRVHAPLVDFHTACTDTARRHKPNTIRRHIPTLSRCAHASPVCRCYTHEVHTRDTRTINTAIVVERNAISARCGISCRRARRS